MELTGELDRRLHGFGTAGNEIDAVEIARCQRRQTLGKVFGRIGGEEARVGVGKPVDLVVDGSFQLGVGMAKTGNRRAAAGIQIALAVGINQKGPFAGDGDRQVGLGMARKNMLRTHLISALVTYDHHALAGMAHHARGIGAEQIVFQVWPVRGHHDGIAFEHIGRVHDFLIN
jgi:hypothetical protein